MTRIIKHDIRLNPKTGRYNNFGIIKKEVKDITHLGKVLESIDYTEATADSPWAEIKFKGEDQRFIELMHRIKTGLI